MWEGNTEMTHKLSEGKLFLSQNGSSPNWTIESTVTFYLFRCRNPEIRLWAKPRLESRSLLYITIFWKSVSLLGCPFSSLLLPCDKQTSNGLDTDQQKWIPPMSFLKHNVQVDATADKRSWGHPTALPKRPMDPPPTILVGDLYGKFTHREQMM